MGQFEGTAFEVHIRLLVFPHAVKVLVFTRLEQRFDPLAATVSRTVAACMKFQRAVLRHLMEQLRTVRCGKTEFAQAFRMPGTGIVLTEHVGGHHKIAVGQGGHTGVFIDGNRDRIPSFMMLVEQSPIRVIDGHFLRCTNPHTVHAPRFDAQGLAFAPPFKRMPIDFHSHGSLSFHLASLSRPNHNFVEPVHIAKITQSVT